MWSKKLGRNFPEFNMSDLEIQEVMGRVPGPAVFTRACCMPHKSPADFRFVDCRRYKEYNAVKIRHSRAVKKLASVFFTV